MFDNIILLLLSKVLLLEKHILLLSNVFIILNLPTKHKVLLVRAQWLESGQRQWAFWGKSERALHFNHTFHIQTYVLNREKNSVY